MANQPYKVVTKQNYGNRMMGSIKGVLIGLILFIAAFPVLWINEGYAVRVYKGLEEGAGSVVAADLNSLAPEMEGQFVHGIGETSTPEILVDSELGVSIGAIHLVRQVEMYQWKEIATTETVEKVGGTEETTTTYTYEPVWSSSLIQSSSFKDPEARTRNANPAQMPYQGQSWSVQLVMIGAYTLSPGLIGQISANQPIDYTNPDLANIPEPILEKAAISKNQIYIGNPGTPQIGDVRISHQYAVPGQVSVLGRVMNGQIGPFRTEQNTTIEILRPGMHSAEEMIEAAKAANVLRTWIFRVLGFFLFFIGLNTILKPLATVGVVLPFLGRLLSSGIGLIAGLIAIILTFVVIAIAWIFYRPLLAIALLVLAGVFTYFLIVRKKKMNQQAAAVEV
ncbi:MAG: hypothetical protein FJ152_00975 [Firmicutes bacterium]|nr:hypothetical protein [Bacillota bacterium]